MMEYAEDLIIAFFDLLLANEYEKWTIGSISAEDYFELRIIESHHHCPCRIDSSDAVVRHFLSKGVQLSPFHKPGSSGVMILKPAG
jgi:hypothetical protein